MNLKMTFSKTSKNVKKTNPQRSFNGYVVENPYRGIHTGETVSPSGNPQHCDKPQFLFSLGVSFVHDILNDSLLFKPQFCLAITWKVRYKFNAGILIAK